MTNEWADIIEWWETDEGKFNWHAKSSNGNILFQSSQGYSNKGDMQRYISQQFPNASIKEREKDA